MPPFAGTATGALRFSHKPAAESSIITLNVGGRIFQTTSQTLAAAGPSSLLSSPPPFIDRDPDMFASLLAFLRTGRLPSASATEDISDLSAEAEFYGIDPRLLFPSSTSSSSLSLQRSLLLPLSGRDPVAVLSASPYGELLAAHGSKISSFNFSLLRRKTFLTSLPAVDSLLSLHHLSLAAAGAADFPGLQIFDLSSGTLRKTLNWRAHPSDPSATVQAICSADERQLLFSSYESGRRNASAILAFDLGSGGDLVPVSEFARHEIYGAELDSAIPATKLKWVPSFNLLMTAGSHWGPSGVVGDIRLWDIRIGGESSQVFDLKEKDDCFADATVSDELSAMFKVGASSGDMFMADLRKLGAGNPWFRLGGGRWNGENSAGKKEGRGCRIESRGRQVFCSRGGDVEVWSEVAMAAAPEFEEKVMRKNLMGREKDMGGARILQMVFGGNRMALARSGESCVEVWENSDHS